MGKTETDCLYYTALPRQNQAGSEDDSMEEYMKYGYPHTAEVAAVVDEIVGMLRPACIYLYNQRFSATGATTSFKLCIIADFADKGDAEKDIYLRIDSEVSFDVLLYTPGEWRRLCEHPDSFARKIFLTGTVVYE